MPFFTQCCQETEPGSSSTDADYIKDICRSGRGIMPGTGLE